MDKKEDMKVYLRILQEKIYDITYAAEIIGNCEMFLKMESVNKDGLQKSLQRLVNMISTYSFYEIRQSIGYVSDPSSVSILSCTKPAKYIDVLRNIGASRVDVVLSEGSETNIILQTEDTGYSEISERTRNLLFVKSVRTYTIINRLFPPPFRALKPFGKTQQKITKPRIKF